MMSPSALWDCRDLPHGSYLQRLTYLSLEGNKLQQLPRALLAELRAPGGDALESRPALSR